jgi:hypothetical protein
MRVPFHRDDGSHEDMLHTQKPTSTPKLTGSGKYRKNFDEKKFIGEECEIRSRRASECSSTASHASREATPSSPADQDSNHKKLGKDGSGVPRSPLLRSPLLQGKRPVSSPAQDENAMLMGAPRGGEGRSPLGTLCMCVHVFIHMRMSMGD